MTRAFTPPETMSKEDIRKVADVRRDIWTAAFWGMGVGSLGCFALHGVARRTKMGAQLNRNTAFLSFLAGGAFGSFLMATTTGKNEVHKIHDVFQVGSKQELEKQQDLLSSINRTEREERARNRVLRRKTIQDTIQHGQGLTDSHGGRWAREDQRFEGQIVFVDEDEERAMRQQNRMLRRKTLQDTIEHGRS
mmetsp:Transcript_21058/g.38241  ORF Transcript_21058/g.38241 Transcript_21058/m.38241 type:complete len:192 (+) Transcript_21058:164-739(+)